MKILVLYVLCTSMLACNNKEQTSNTLKGYYEFCNSEINFPDNDSNQVIISIKGDSLKHGQNIKDVFFCIEKKITENKLIRAAFQHRSKTISIYVLNENNLELSKDLIEIEDSSSIWKGDLGKIDSTNVDAKMVGINKKFTELIIASGYVKNWEESLNKILGKSVQWEYFTERTNGGHIEFKKTKKQYYPISFDIVLRRKLE